MQKKNYSGFRRPVADGLGLLLMKTDEKKNKLRTDEKKNKLRHTWLKYQLAWMTPHVAGKFWCCRKKRTAEHHVNGKFWCGRKKRNCSMRGWKICAVGKKGTAEHVNGKFVLSEKKELQNTWMENFGAVGKKELQNTTWMENFTAVGKNSCRTRGWKMLVRSEKNELNCKTCDWKILVPWKKKEHVPEKVRLPLRKIFVLHQTKQETFA